MTDEGFGMATREAVAGRGSAAFLWGANAALYVIFAAAMLAGLAVGQLLPNPTAIGLDVIFPLSFIALVLPMPRARTDAVVALVGGIGALALRGPLGAGPAILAAVSAAALLGAGAPLCALGRLRGADRARVGCPGRDRAAVRGRGLHRCGGPAPGQALGGAAGRDGGLLGAARGRGVAIASRATGIVSVGRR